MNAVTSSETPQSSDEAFIEQITLATLALELEAQAPVLRPSLVRRVGAWFAGLWEKTP